MYQAVIDTQKLDFRLYMALASTVYEERFQSRSSDKSDCDSFAIVSSASSKDPVSISFTKCRLSESVRTWH